MTGRRAGFCAGYDVPGYASPGFRWGFGRGFGWGGGGRGWRHRFYATGVPGWAGYGYYGPAGPVAPSLPREQEVDLLKTHTDWSQARIHPLPVLWDWIFYPCSLTCLRFFQNGL